MLFPFILAFALSLNGSWDFRFEEGKALKENSACPQMHSSRFVVSMTS